MSFCIGNKLKFTIFGASHDILVGGILEGLPAGFPIDFSFIADELTRRRPSGTNETDRIEMDEYAFISGLNDGKTTEAPFAFALRNENIRKDDYMENLDKFRPGHADYAKFIKYEGNAFPTGGGIFSGRMTAPIVVAGAVAKDMLRAYDVYIDSRIISGGSGRGAKIRVQVSDCPAGMGEPFFDSLESKISHMMFSIPAVKGVNFGNIMEAYDKDVMEFIDSYVLKNGKVKSAKNTWGGIEGGISNGSEIYFDVLVKPIQSVAEEIKTLDKNFNKTVIKTMGRHDRDISKRIQVVLENATALVMLDVIMEAGI